MCRPRLPLLVLLLVAAAAAACAPTSAELQASALTTFKGGPMIEGVARAPAKLVEAALVTTSPSPAAALEPGRYAQLALRDEVPLTDAVVTLTDPTDNHYRLGGKPISVLTDRTGAFRFQGGFPRNVPVIVAAALNGHRRVVGFTVPGEGTTRLPLSVASTCATEFLRAAAKTDGKSMADYDLEQFSGLVATTEALLATGELPMPALDVAAIPALVRAYAVAVGQDAGGLGDRWARLLGRRVIALVTVAGSGIAGGGGDGQVGGQAEFYRPRAVVADRAGHLFVADTGNQKVRRIDAQTEVVTTFAGSGRDAFGGDGGDAREAHLDDPSAVAFDQGGNLHVADRLNGRIRRIDALTGRIETIAGLPVPDGTGGWFGVVAGDGAAAKLARFYAPHALAFDPAGDLYVVDSEADATAHLIRKIDLKTGVIRTVVGTPGAGGAFAGDGGRPEAARLNFPHQIAFDAQGRLIIADAFNHCIRRVDLQARTIVTIAGIGGQRGDDPDGQAATQTRLDTPCGVAVAPDGRLFLSERVPGRVRTVGPDGLMQTLGGGGTSTRDGEARAVSLLQPQGLFVEATGDLLIADTRGARIRRLILRHGL